MKIFVSVVFVLMLTGVVTSENGKNDVPNRDIITILNNILKRLDTIENEVKLGREDTKDVQKQVQRNQKETKDLGKQVQRNREETKDVGKQVQANREETKGVRRQVQANQEVLLKLDAHVKDQQEKVKEVKQEIQVEKHDIAANTKSVKEVAVHNAQLSELITVNLHNISKDISEVKDALTEVLPGKSQMRPARSCSWIKRRSYCVRSGNFWIKNGGKPRLQFCDMGNHKQVTTTTAIPTTHSTTTYPTTTIPTTKPLSTVPIYHSASCKELKRRHPHLKSGTYNINVGGSTFGVYCDMETDGGGWIMVGRAVVDKDSEAEEMDFQKIRQDDYSSLQNVTSGRFLLSSKGLNLLYNVHKFTEVRFDCYKSYHGRRLNLKTKGAEIVQWLLLRKCSPTPPFSATITSLKGDTSFLVGHAHWNYCKGLYFNPMYACDGEYKYFVGLDYGTSKALWCDDDTGRPHFNNIGTWSYYVR